MAAVVDRRFDNAYPVGGNAYEMNSGPALVSAPNVVAANQTVVTDSYGGWLTRGQRALVFGLVGFALVLGLFLPGIILLGMNWNSVRNDNGGCATSVTDRALTICCFYIFHALVVIPMFIKGDTAQTVTVGNQYGTGLQSFWTSRIAHTAFILQIVGNLIELALLIWLAVPFWGGNYGGTNCSNNHKHFYDYTWALLIGGFVLSTLSLVTSYQQYTSAAIRYQYGNGKNGGVLNSAP